MAEGNKKPRKSRIKDIDEKRNYFIEEMNQNDLISKKDKNLYGFKLHWGIT